LPKSWGLGQRLVKEPAEPKRYQTGLLKQCKHGLGCNTLVRALLWPSLTRKEIRGSQQADGGMITDHSAFQETIRDQLDDFGVRHGTERLAVRT
jgi:hypothetical protein